MTQESFEDIIARRGQAPSGETAFERFLRAGEELAEEPAAREAPSFIEGELPPPIQPPDAQAVSLTFEPPVAPPAPEGPRGFWEAFVGAAQQDVVQSLLNAKRNAPFGPELRPLGNRLAEIYEANKNEPAWRRGILALFNRPAPKEHR